MLGEFPNSPFPSPVIRQQKAGRNGGDKKRDGQKNLGLGQVGQYFRECIWTTLTIAVGGA